MLGEKDDLVTTERQTHTPGQGEQTPQRDTDIGGGGVGSGSDDGGGGNGGGGVESGSDDDSGGNGGGGDGELESGVEGGVEGGGKAGVKGGVKGGDEGSVSGGVEAGVEGGVEGGDVGGGGAGGVDAGGGGAGGGVGGENGGEDGDRGANGGGGGGDDGGAERAPTTTDEGDTVTRGATSSPAETGASAINRALLAANRRLAREVAGASVVLLKNKPARTKRKLNGNAKRTKRKLNGEGQPAGERKDTGGAYPTNIYQKRKLNGAGQTGGDTKDTAGLYPTSVDQKRNLNGAGQPGGETKDTGGVYPTSVGEDTGGVRAAAGEGGGAIPGRGAQIPGGGGLPLPLARGARVVLLGSACGAASLGNHAMIYEHNNSNHTWENPSVGHTDTTDGPSTGDTGVDPMGHSDHHYNYTNRVNPGSGTYAPTGSTNQPKNRTAAINSTSGSGGKHGGGLRGAAGVGGSGNHTVGGTGSNGYPSGSANKDKGKHEFYTVGEASNHTEGGTGSNVPPSGSTNKDQGKVDDGLWWAAGDYYTVGGSGRVLFHRHASLLSGLLATASTSKVEVVRWYAGDEAMAAETAMEGADVAIACGGGDVIYIYIYVCI